MIGLRPSLVLAVGLITILAPLFDGGTTQLPVCLIRLAVIAAGGVWIVVSMRREAVMYRWGVTSAIALAFLALAILSLLWTPYKEAAIQWVVTLIIYVTFFHMVLLGVRTDSEVQLLLSLILGVGLFEGLLGVVQYVWMGAYRATGTFFNPNFFATYELGVMALVMALLCFAREDELGKSVRRTLWCIGIISVSAFLMARSRGAALAALPVVAFVGFARFGKAVFPALLACVIALVALPNPVQERIREVSAHDPFAFTRIEIWKNSLNRVAHQPWGVGLGMYKYASFQSRFPLDGEIVRFGKRAESAHNEYLQIMAELGVAGLLIFLVGAVAWLKEARRVCREEDATVRRGVLVGLTGVVLAVLVHALVDSVFHEPALVLLMLLAAGIVLARGRSGDAFFSRWSETSFRYTRGRAVLVSLVLSILVVLTIQPAVAWYAFDQGDKEAGSGQMNRALEWYQRATMVAPGNAAYHSAVASAQMSLFQESGEPARILDAIEELKLGMQLNALDGRFPYRAGTLYQLLGDRVQSPELRADLLAEATKCYQIATEKDPFSPVNYAALGTLLWQQGHIAEAQRLFSIAHQFEPNYLPARALRIRAALESGDLDTARSDYRAILSIRQQYEQKAATSMERQFLDVDVTRLEALLRPWGLS